MAVDNSDAKGLLLMLIGLPPQLDFETNSASPAPKHYHTDEFSESLP
jgi:hypothetical protein